MTTGIGPVKRARPTADGLVAAVLGACDGAARGAIPAFAVVIVATLVGMLGASAWALTTSRWPGSSYLFMEAPIALVLSLPVAFVAARRSTETIVRETRAGVQRAGIAIAIGGGVLLTLAFLFLIRVPMGPAMALVEATAVGAWVAGAILADRPAPAVSNRRRVVLGTLLGAGIFVAIGPMGARSVENTTDPPEPDLTRAAAALPTGEYSPVGWESSMVGGDAVVVRLTDDGEPSAGWSDARVEVWAATRLDGGGVFPSDQVGSLDPTVAGPVRVVALANRPPSSAVVRIGDIRGLDTARVVLTASIGGKRFVLGSMPVVASYDATILEWISSLAPGSTLAVQHVTP